MRFIIFAIITSCVVLGCSSDQTSKGEQTAAGQYRMRTLPPVTPNLIEEEWAAYRKAHPELSEGEARHRFVIIQTMSAEHYDEYTAAWAERRALANAWLKNEIEAVYHPSTVTDDMIRAAIDAYAFKSGHPTLVTASHLLIKPDEHSTAEMRRSALEAVRSDLVRSGGYSDEALRIQAQRLIRAGYHVDMNADLTFPRQPMTSFLGEQLSYMAVVEPFAKAAFELTADNPLSPVTESEFGYHIILFKSRAEGQKADFERDAEFIRQSTVEQGRKMASRQMIDQLMQSGDIRVDEARLARMAGSAK